MTLLDEDLEDMAYTIDGLGRAAKRRGKPVEAYVVYGYARPKNMSYGGNVCEVHKTLATAQARVAKLAAEGILVWDGQKDTMLPLKPKELRITRLTAEALPVPTAVKPATKRKAKK